MLEHKTPEEKVKAVLDLLADAGVITHKSAYELRDLSQAELGHRLHGERISA